MTEDKNTQATVAAELALCVEYILTDCKALEFTKAAFFLEYAKKELDICAADKNRKWREDSTTSPLKTTG